MKTRIYAAPAVKGLKLHTVQQTRDVGLIKDYLTSTQNHLLSWFK